MKISVFNIKPELYVSICNNTKNPDVLDNEIKILKTKGPAFYAARCKLSIQEVFTLFNNMSYGILPITSINVDGAGSISLPFSVKTRNTFAENTVVKF